MIVAGFGFRASATAESIAGAYSAARGAHAADRLATAADKAGHPALLAFADETGLAVDGVAPDMLGAQATETRSGASLDARGTGSVAEAAALAAAGPGARLLAPRAVSPDARATCALAIGGPE